MKKNLFKLAGLVISAMLLGACSQLATYENEDLLTDLAKSEQAGFKLSAFGSASNENARLSTSGNFNLNYTETVCVGDNITFSFGGTGFTGTRTVQLQQLVDGEWIQVFQQAQAPKGVSGSLSGYAVGTYTFRWKVSGQGGQQNVEFTVEVENCGTCQESFSYVDKGDLEPYTFTYIPSESMPAAELVFTFAQGVAVTGLDTWSTKGVTRQKTMDLVACQVYTWTVDLAPNCSGQSPNSNVWTDFKVNEVSKKGDLATITEACR
ncbi:hypothetical protein [Algoriphagus aquimarinus]|uniref:Lipoprotein n=1 Tax=Algoriphagus aquimarinus TaxID=237018 RepID=A0A1I1CEV6_9BACT|nr:hypothetical protein [Algoriphagus aquimarinus]SFB61104.1 hypothetical protein SAMN04489723_13219 [Algoriphagus aquimarinus]